MAASCVSLAGQGLKAFGLRHLPSLYQGTARYLHVSQSCLSKNNKTRRTKAPPEAKEKDKKWVSRKALAKLQAERARRTEQNQSFIADAPVDDVWIQMNYPRVKHDVQSIIDFHREIAVPEMYDNTDGLLYLSTELDMTTKKKTKFVQDFMKTILLPNYFEEGPANRVVAFCATEVEKEKAIKVGAAFVGGTELVKSFEQGEIKHDVDFDYVVASVDVMPDLRSLRKILKEHMPDKKKGSVGDDVERMVETFVNGKTYKSVKHEDDWGEVNVAFGRLNMPTEHLLENFQAFVNAICSHRSRDIGPFIKRAFITCPPSKEEFEVVAEELLQTEDESAKRKGDKKLRAAVA